MPKAREKNPAEETRRLLWHSERSEETRHGMGFIEGREGGSRKRRIVGALTVRVRI